MTLMDKRTKIVATISDKRCEPSFIRRLVEEGINVVRLNSAHIDKEGFDRLVDNIRSVAPDIPILIDTKGAEIRTTRFEQDVHLCTGCKVTIVADPNDISTANRICVNYENFVRDVPVGARVLIDDGEVELRVLDKDEHQLYCEVENDGELGSRKSVNVPDVHIDLPSVSQRDHDFILYAIEREIAFIAHSFVRNRADVEAVQKVLDEHGGQGIKVISKIENQEGVDNIEEILDASYGIMVARGDLGIEIDFEKIPALQSDLIHRAILKKKPVIVATQMLHTMIHYPRPTRAEVSDVSGAIMMNTDAVMLSGETAYGKYPAEAVRTMARIIKEAERHQKDRGGVKLKKGEDDVVDVTSYLAKYTVKSTSKLGVKAIVTDVVSGRCARNLSAYRGEAPIYAICQDARVARQLNLSYGIYPIYQSHEGYTRRQYYAKALEILLNKGLLELDDMIAYIGGTLKDEVGTTSLDISRVRDVLEYFASTQDQR
ncbi:Pyruvate kinase [Porphyromonas levii]|nr:Pyruvate kinase [Porphyromonas levii]MBR8714444.1 Pyruvate kinase [Porphyromonas levii]MBR8726985.1 Pyruvate kinase [Porphyromonas levii]MBR8731217.1 Pyruvate kinase [Porphyromonas levii]MBR8735224.1 Pyruvate kinase [Porphyromonas levii]